MKQKLFIFVFLLLLVLILVGLNAASYTQKVKTPDSEFSPNRSTFNSGATGTQALYTLLAETGRRVKRWQVPPSGLLGDKKRSPSVFVVIGPLKREFEKQEVDDLKSWVADGGKLVLIDREPPEDLISARQDWKITFDATQSSSIFTVDPSDAKQMIGEVAVVKPVQPGVYATGVNAVQPSQFASGITFEKAVYDDGRNGRSGLPGMGSEAPPPPRSAVPNRYPANTEPGDKQDAISRHPLSTGLEKVPKPPDTIQKKPVSQATIKTVDQPAADPSPPVVYFASGSRNLVAEIGYGNGRIVLLSDPFTVSNSGISLADNAQMVINITSTVDGTIVFDEYHQGFGANNNRFLQFFEGTPIVGIFLQGLVLLGFIFYSQSRRFARAVPEHETDRLSKLEYVSAMAELQMRTRAFDLAIENIYTDFRRRVSRLLGVDNHTTKRDELARLIAERTGLERDAVDNTMFKCEDIIHGEPTNKREVVELSGALRVLEEKLRLTRGTRTRI